MLEAGREEGLADEALAGSAARVEELFEGDGAAEAGVAGAEDAADAAAGELAADDVRGAVDEGELGGVGDATGEVEGAAYARCPGKGWWELRRVVGLSWLRFGFRIGDRGGVAEMAHVADPPANFAPVFWLLRSDPLSDSA